MVEYDKLDNDQKDFVDNEINKQGNIWVKGFAGSGKSVLILHAVRQKLASNPNLKVCIVVFTHSLIDMFKTGMNELNMTHVPIMTYHKFKKGYDNYDYIFCDEVQDLPANVLREMNNRSKAVYVAGDSNQSIYQDVVSPPEIGSILNARPFVLTRIYRLTRSIINAVSKMLPNLDIFGAKRDMTKRDVEIRLFKADDESEEINYVWEKASEAAANGYSSVILLPQHHNILNFANTLFRNKGKQTWSLVKNNWGKPDYSSLNRHFSTQGIKAQYVGNSYGSFELAAKRNHVIIMTYHSSKGMDFENVFLPFLSSDTSIAYSDGDTLFMVAMTRSKTNLYITYSGRLHSFVKRFESSCQKVSFKEEVSNDSFNFDF